MRRRQAIAVLALAGVFVALYLWLHKLGLIGVLQCGTGGCDTVQASAYADLFSLPVAVYGVIGYTVLLVLSMIAVRQPDARPGRPDAAIAVLASLGFLFTVYLTALELFVIHAFCRWCLASAAIITGITVLSLARVRRRA